MPTPTDSAPIAWAAATSLGVSPMNHPALGHGRAEHGRSTLGAPADERRPVLGVAAESSEGEPMVDADALELDARPLADVPGPEAHRGVRERVGGVEGLGHPGVHAVGGVGRGGHLLGEHPQVVDQHLVDARLGGLDVDGPQPGADDGAVGHPVEPEAAAGIPAAVGALEGDLQRTTAHTSGGDQGAVDVEEQDGGAHVKGWARASAAWSCSRTPDPPRALTGPRATCERRDHRRVRVPARPRSGWTGRRR